MRHRSISVAAALALALLLAAPSSSAAGEPADGGDDLARARRALDELDYDVAWLSLERALRAGDHDPDELVEIYELSGRVAAAFGDPDDAYELFQKMLALEPERTLGPRMSPKIARPFERARTYFRRRPSLEVRFEPVPGEPTQVHVVVAADPLEMVAGVEVDGEPVALVGDASTVALPRDAHGEVRIVVVDRHGNHLAETGWRARRAAAPVAPAEAPLDLDARAGELPAPGTPIYRRWYVWSGLAVAATGVSLYFGKAAQDDWRELDRVVQNSSNYTFDDALEIERRGRRHEFFSNFGLGSAIVCAAAALVLPHVAFEF
jgi:tetratricopeptide (TPR) repeat protein